MANLCIKTPSSASLVLIFQLLVLRPRPTVHLAVVHPAVHLAVHQGVNLTLHLVQLALHLPLYLHITHISPNRHNTDKYEICTHTLATIGLHHALHLPLGLPSLECI